MDRRDYLKECNNLGSPVGDFQSFFCNRCLQPECTRSNFGKSKFDQRVSTWKERLFLNVPRMDPTDSRFKDISVKQFQPALDSWEISSEVLTLEEPTPVSLELATPTEVTIQESDWSEGTNLLAEPEVRSTEKSLAAETQTSSLEALALMNTPNKEGLYIPGGLTVPAKSKIGGRLDPKSGVRGGSRNDPWAVPEQNHSSEVVVESGATIRLGGGSK